MASPRFKIEALLRMKLMASDTHSSIEIDSDVEVDSQPITDGENISTKSGTNVCVKLQTVLMQTPNTFTKLTSVGGVDIKIGSAKEGHYLILVSKGHVIGYLKIVPTDEVGKVKHMVKESFLKEEERSKGYGTLLYKQAIKKFKCLCSSANIGSMAVRTWKSLSKIYDVKIWCTTFDKAFPYTWGENNEPIINGYRMTRLRTEEFVFYVITK